MFSRDEEWERRAAVDHIESLRDLLRKGQDLDTEVHGKDGTLREWLRELRSDIDKAIG